MVYWSMFLSSLLFLYISEKINIGRKVLVFIGLLMPIVLASLRNESVGIDISTYIKPMYRCVMSSNNFSNYVWQLKNNFETRDLEWGFVFIGYFSSKILGGIWGMHFIYEAVIIINIYLSIKKFNNNLAEKCKVHEIPVWLGMFIYYTSFYNMSLTMIRQSVAVSFSMFSIICFMSKEYKRTIVYLLAAVLIHSTSIFSLVFIVLYYIVNSDRKILKRLYWVFLIVFTFFGRKLYFVLLKLVNYFIPVSARYLSETYMDFTGNDLNLAWFFMIIVSITVTWFLYKKQKQNRICEYMFFLMLTQIMFLPLSVISSNAGRILYYFMYFTVLTIPILRDAIKFSGNRKIAANIMVVLYGVIYWLGTVGLNDITGTAHYIIN